MVLCARMVRRPPGRRLVFPARNFDRTWKIGRSTRSPRERITHTNPEYFQVESSNQYRGGESAPTDLQSSFDALRFASAPSCRAAVAGSEGGCSGNIFRF